MLDMEPLTESEMMIMEDEAARPWERLVIVRREDFKRLTAELRALRAVVKSTPAERDEIARLRKALAIYAETSNWREQWDEYQEHVIGAEWQGEDYKEPWNIAQKALGMAGDATP